MYTDISIAVFHTAESDWMVQDQSTNIESCEKSNIKTIQWAVIDLSFGNLPVCSGIIDGTDMQKHK